MEQYVFGKKDLAELKKLARKICELTLTLVGLYRPDGGCQPPTIE
jgi:hypothetical protein